MKDEISTFNYHIYLATKENKRGKPGKAIIASKTNVFQTIRSDAALATRHFFSNAFKNKLFFFCLFFRIAKKGRHFVGTESGSGSKTREKL